MMINDMNRASPARNFHARKGILSGFNASFTAVSKKSFAYYDYLMGNDSVHWKCNMGLFVNLHYHGIYLGIDLLISSEQESLKYDFAFNMDPMMVFVTITGSTADNWGFILAYGQNGSLYASVGNRVPVHSTYIGGSPGDLPHSLVVDDTNERILIGSSFIGGSGDDGINIFNWYWTGLVTLKHNYGDDAPGEVFVDDLEITYDVACTSASVSLKFTLGSITALENAYMGGSNDDAGYVLTLDGICILMSTTCIIKWIGCNVSVTTRCKEYYTKSALPMNIRAPSVNAD